MKSPFRLLFVLIFAAGCSAGGASLPSRTVPSASQPSFVSPHAAANAKIAFDIPSKGVSTAVRAIVVKVNGKIVLSGQIATGATHYSEKFGVPAGDDTFDIALADGYTRAVSQSSFAKRVTSGTTVALSPRFDGILSSGSLSASPTSPPAGKPATIAVTFTGWDADGQAITSDRYSKPVAVHFVQGDKHMTERGAAFTGPNQTVSVKYDGRTQTAASTLDLPDFSGAQALTFLSNSYRTMVSTISPIEDMIAGPGDSAIFTVCSNTGSGCKIQKVDATGTIHTIASTSIAVRLALANDGSIWFSEGEPGPSSSSAKIGRVDTNGKIKQFDVPNSSGVGAMAPGPDGNVWFSELSGVGSVTPSGTISQYHNSSAFWYPPPYMIAGGKNLFWAGPFNGICKAATDGTNSCFGEGGNGAPNTYTGPLVWYANKLLMQAWNGTTASYANGTIEKIKTIGRTRLIPAAVDAKGRLFGFSDETFGGHFARLTLANGQLSGLVYPQPNFNQVDPTRLIMEPGDNAWMQSDTVGIVRFTYYP